MSVRSAAPRDDVAFSRFYDAHWLNVLAYCRRRVGPNEADDAAIAVFSAAWRKWADVPKDDRALPWLYGAAHREVLHHWRSKARRRRLIERARSRDSLAPPEPDHIVIQAVESALAMNALARLRADDREILRLVLWEELTPAEIAIVLGCRIDAVRKRFSRANSASARSTGPWSTVTQEPLRVPRKEVTDDER